MVADVEAGIMGSGKGVVWSGETGCGLTGQRAKLDVVLWTARSSSGASAFGAERLNSWSAFEVRGVDWSVFVSLEQPSPWT